MANPQGANSFPGRVSIVPVVIGSGNTESNAIGLGAGVICGITTPSALSGGTFHVESTIDDGVSFQPVLGEDGVDLTLTVAADSYIKVSPQDYAGINKLRIVSGTPEGADRTIQVHYRAID